MPLHYSNPRPFTQAYSSLRSHRHSQAYIYIRETTNISFNERLATLGETEMCGCDRKYYYCPVCQTAKPVYFNWYEACTDPNACTELCPNKTFVNDLPTVTVTCDACQEEEARERARGGV
jgi:hypothetical protein